MAMMLVTTVMATMATTTMVVLTMAMVARKLKTNFLGYLWLRFGKDPLGGSEAATGLQRVSLLKPPVQWIRFKKQKGNG
jgi:hypothetical protein